MLHSLTCTSSANMRTRGQTAEVRLKLMRCRQIIFVDVHQAFKNMRTNLNKPIGSFRLKYAGTKRRFYYCICSASRIYIGTSRLFEKPL
jgi:hypothetical protein